MANYKDLRVKMERVIDNLYLDIADLTRANDYLKENTRVAVSALGEKDAEIERLTNELQQLRITSGEVLALYETTRQQPAPAVKPVQRSAATLAVRKDGDKVRVGDVLYVAEFSNRAKGTQVKSGKTVFYLDANGQGLLPQSAVENLVKA